MNLYVQVYSLCLFKLLHIIIELYIKQLIIIRKVGYNMIYGNVVRSYANSKYGSFDESSLTRESDAILEALQREYDNYSNAIVNESYFASGREKAILEAKFEVIQEALSGAIIAAIIAGIAALIGIIVAVVLILKKGKKKVDKKAAAANASSLSDEEKKKLVDEVINDVNEGDEDTFKLTAHSSVDFTEYINIDFVKNITNDVKAALNGDVNESKLEEIREMLDDQNKLNAKIFKGFNPGSGSFKESLMTIYNNKTTPYIEVLNDIQKTKAEAEKLEVNADKVCNELRRNLEELKKEYENVKNKYSENSNNPNKIEHIDEYNKITQKTINSIKQFMAAWKSIESRRTINLTRLMGALSGTKKSEDSEKKKEDK